ncbi:MAG TPA: SRPBCC domain-containing protein [Candidatus Angelobacter sp.]
MKSDVTISGKRIQITRIFNAPRELVFTYWKRADKLQQWSGCKEATKCEIQMDFRVGGSFTQKMNITGAGEFTITGQYDEIVEPERIAYHADLRFAVSRVMVEFFDLGKQTKVVLTQEGLPDEMMCNIVSQGTTESLEKLDQLLIGQPVGHGVE